MSVELHRNEPRLFEHGAEHDRGARAQLRFRGRPAQVAQDPLEALEIGCRDLEDVAVLARDVMTLEHPRVRSEEHTSELQSPCNLVCRLLLEKKKIRSA